MDNNKAHAVFIVTIIILALIIFGALSAFVKVQSQVGSNAVTGMSAADPDPASQSVPRPLPPEQDKTPPKAPTFSIE